MRVVVTGTTGCVGGELADAMRDAGVEVVPLDRGAGRGTDLLGDGYGAGLRDAGPLGAVVHCAALVHAHAGASADAFLRANVAAPLALLEHAAAAGARRFVFVSTIAVYGDAFEIASADAPTRPATPYAVGKLEAEERLRAAADRLGVELRIVRLATVYGPRDRGNLGRMADALRRGRYLALGAGRQPKSLVDVRTAARDLVRAALDPSFPSLHVSADPVPSSMAAIETAMSAALGVAAPKRLPVPLAHLAGVAGSLLRAAGLPAPLDRGTVRRYLAPVAVRLGGLGPEDDPAAALERRFSEIYARR